MGRHYVPQAYLRAFETRPDSGLVWMFDKQSRAGRVLPIRGVAQAPDYYDSDVEQQLNSIEGPAHASIQRVLTERRIREEDRRALTMYAAVMLYRVPRRRRKGLELAPGVVEDVLGGIGRAVEAWAATKAPDDPLVARRRAELAAAAAKYRGEVPEAINDQLRTPWPTAAVCSVIAQMTWRLVMNETAQAFVTSDNPVFFFEAYGLANPQSELTFPLSPKVALLADSQAEPASMAIVHARPGLVREVNRRIVSTTERFVFSNRPQQWVPNVAAKARPYLSRIAWEHN